MNKTGNQDADMKMASILIFKKSITDENLMYITQLFGLMAPSIGAKQGKKTLLEEFLYDCKTAPKTAVFNPELHIETISECVLDRISLLKMLDPAIYTTRAIATTGVRSGTSLEKRATAMWLERVKRLHKVHRIYASSDAASVSEEGSFFNKTAADLFFNEVASEEDIGKKISHYARVAREEELDGRAQTLLCTKSISYWADAVREIPNYIERALFGHYEGTTMPEGTKLREAAYKLMHENGLDPERPDPKYFRGHVQRQRKEL